jgi:hypothetical protein
MDSIMRFDAWVRDMHLYTKFKTAYLLWQITAGPEKGFYFKKLDKPNVIKHRVRSYNALAFLCPHSGLWCIWSICCQSRSISPHDVVLSISVGTYFSKLYLWLETSSNRTKQVLTWQDTFTSIKNPSSWPSQKLIIFLVICILGPWFYAT